MNFKMNMHLNATTTQRIEEWEWLKSLLPGTVAHHLNIDDVVSNTNRLARDKVLVHWGSTLLYTELRENLTDILLRHLLAGADLISLCLHRIDNIWPSARTWRHPTSLNIRGET